MIFSKIRLNRKLLETIIKLGLEYRLDKTHFIEYTLHSLKKELKLAGLKFISYSIQFGEIWARIQSV